MIFVGEKLLLIRYRDGEGEFYVCVGGGQNTGERVCAKTFGANAARR